MLYDQTSVFISQSFSQFVLTVMEEKVSILGQYLRVTCKGRATKILS